ncbi:MAG: leucine-rich repeat protein [Oscillospiraceae bacterium]|nr:leucine-rich repeat protein [Oscillospiraceae bacterium]
MNNPLARLFPTVPKKFLDMVMDYCSADIDTSMIHRGVYLKRFSELGILDLCRLLAEEKFNMPEERINTHKEYLDYVGGIYGKIQSANAYRLLLHLSAGNPKALERVSNNIETSTTAYFSLPSTKRWVGIVTVKDKIFLWTDKDIIKKHKEMIEEQNLKTVNLTWSRAAILIPTDMEGGFVDDRGILTLDMDFVLEFAKICLSENTPPYEKLEALFMQTGDYIVFASNNRKKIAEAKEILGEEIYAPADLGIEHDTVEDGATFEHNALKKAREMCKLTGKLSIADDSGICVDALGGAPGLHSSIYYALDDALNPNIVDVINAKSASGNPDIDKLNNEKLLRELSEATNRSAHYVCVIAIVMVDGTEKTVRAEWHGEIATDISESNGFAYDKVFVYNGKRASDMTPEEKNQISHRGKALKLAGHVVNIHIKLEQYLWLALKRKINDLKGNLSGTEHAIRSEKDDGWGHWGMSYKDERVNWGHVSKLEVEAELIQNELAVLKEEEEFINIRRVEIIGDTITDDAFSGCTSLAGITIPNSVTSIGSSAFYECESLKDIVIPDGVKTIGDSAFSGCTSLAGITIPNSVTSIGSSAFIGCTSLKDIVIPDGIRSIGDSAFRGCTSLAGITIPNSVTSIERLAFDGCESLKDIVIPNSVTSIETWAFRDCTSLAGITIPDSVTTIRNSAFNGCKSLKDIFIPESVNFIGKKAFLNCDSLTIVTPFESYAWKYAVEFGIKHEIYNGV